VTISARIRGCPTQKVCSAPCRIAWRRKEAKRRRASDLEGHQKADRARQQAVRESRRTANAGPAPTSEPLTPTPNQPVTSTEHLSRAGFPVQPLDITNEILLSWDKASRLSRAGLKRDLAKILGENASILGHVGQGLAPVTHQDAGAKLLKSFNI